MSSATNLRSAAFALAVFMAACTTHAAVECPQSNEGRPLARYDGASLFQGDPVYGMMLAPSNENSGGSDINVWNLPDPAGIVLVCRYEGLRQAVVLNLPSDVRQCRQGVAGRSFSCQ